MNTKMRTRNNSRSGVTLLFTISMIVLFLLMGTTFVVVANDYFKSARRRNRVNTYRIDATSLLDRAFYDVFRGPDLNDISSSLRTHSILEDQYGYGQGAIVDSVDDGAIDGLKMITIAPSNFSEIVDGSPFTVTDKPDGFFGGCVLTFVTGEARGYSSRIVSSYLDTAGTGNLLIVIPTDTRGIDWGLVSGEDQVVINGRDFTGDGAGDIVGTFTPDMATGLGTRVGDGILTPNRIGQSLATLISGDSGTGILPYIPTGNSVNEPWDIADENNWFLAGEDASGDPIPSFHRDTFYEDGLANIGRSPGEIRSFSFRPVYIDDDAIDGSNAQVSDTGPGTSRFGEFHELDSGADLAGDLVNAVNDSDGLDVDTDGDGTNDAVWIDIGLPVQTDDQGRLFKPLVAYRIIDMDNRLNVNAHGSYADQELGSGTRRGGNYGVAEVSLAGITTDTTAYANLLSQRSGTVPGNAANALGFAQTLFGYVNHGANTGNLFASGADVFGTNIVGRDTSVYGEDALQGFTTYSTVTGSSLVSPYAADLGIGGGVGDSLFQAVELEALMRDQDADSSLLTSRLRGLGGAANIDEITTDSAEIAMPPAAVTSLLFGATGDDIGIYRDLVSLGYLSEDVLMGGMFDLNQPTGNGFDNDGDGIVDEPDELLTAQPSSRHDGLAFDLSNEGDGALGDNLVRQRKANQLYILALLATGDTPPAFAGEFASAVAYRRAVAQWAVNVVDFIDPDSIMTAFEYDTEPFDAMLIDGDPTTDDSATQGQIVFGAERPELLITETFTTHSRRNQDTGSDNGDNDDTASGNDLDWDSTHLPVSSVLIELYNPWTQLDAINGPRFGATAANATQVPPAELYSAQTRGSDDYYGVDLRRLAPDGTPVWRIGVKREEADTTFLRAIFMADPSGAASDALIAGDNFFPGYQDAGGTDVVPNVVEPGSFFVLGSSGNVNTTPGSFTMTFGRRTSNLPDVPATRSIQLVNTEFANELIINDPSGSLDGTTVNAGSDGVPETGFGVAVIDQFIVSDGTTITQATRPRSLSLSDPNGGYLPIVAATGVVTTDEDDGVMLTPAIDEPLDAVARGGRNAVDLDMIWNNGTNDSFRFLSLQRLADPTQPFNELHNPYITIDSAEVDLVAFNGLNNDANNDGTMESAEVAAGTVRVTTSTNTALVSSERGENRMNLGVAPSADLTNAARRTFFRTADIEAAGSYVNSNAGLHSGADNHNFSFSFDNGAGLPLISFGARNRSFGGGLPYSTPTGTFEPLGELVWLNRPMANSMELVHVPIVPNGPKSAEQMPTLLDYFNRCRNTDDIPAVTTASTPQETFAYYFGDDKFGHLMGFGGMAPVDGGAGAMNGGASPPPAPTRSAPTRGNRFDLVFDFVDVPSKFQGLRTWLGDTTTFTATPTAPASGMFFNLRPPYNSLPSFREPGKINVNSVTEGDVLDAMVGGFSSRNADFAELRGLRDTTETITDFGGRFVPATRAQYVRDEPRSNAEAGLFRRDTGDSSLRQFDFESTAPESDTDTSSWYENEYRQRLGAIATTRSSVFSIWITIGYFEVDQYGRVGQELGSDEGQPQRNRAFYMVDRSIPVACEPGKNHNVDQAVLVRTIIE